MLRSGKVYGSVSTDNNSSVFSRTSKAMKMMALTEHHNDNKSVGAEMRKIGMCSFQEKYSLMIHFFLKND